MPLAPVSAPKAMAVPDDIQGTSDVVSATPRSTRAQRRNAKSSNVSVKDVQDFVDETDVHVTYVKCAQKTCKKVWGRLPDARNVMHEAEKAMEHYNAVADKFLAGTEADNEANRETAPAVTAAALQAIKKAAEPLVEQSEALKSVLAQERDRLQVVVKGRIDDWQRGFDNCLVYLLVFVLFVTCVWWCIGFLRDVWAGDDSESFAETAAPIDEFVGGTAEPVLLGPEVATITDEL